MAYTSASGRLQIPLPADVPGRKADLDAQLHLADAARGTSSGYQLASHRLGLQVDIRPTDAGNLDSRRRGASGLVSAYSSPGGVYSATGQHVMSGEIHVMRGDARQSHHQHPLLVTSPYASGATPHRDARQAAQSTPAPAPPAHQDPLTRAERALHLSQQVAHDATVVAAASAEAHRQQAASSMQGIRREAEEVQRLRRELDAASVRLESTRSDLERRSAETAELRGQLSRLSTLASLLLRHVDPAHAEEFSRAFADISLHVGDAQTLGADSNPLRTSALGGSSGPSGGRSVGSDVLAAASTAAAQTVRSALSAQSPGGAELPEVFTARAPSQVALQSALELALQRTGEGDSDPDPEHGHDHDHDSAYAAAYFSAAAARSSRGEAGEVEEEERYTQHRGDALRRAEFYAALQSQQQRPAAAAGEPLRSAHDAPADIWDTAHAAAAALPGDGFGGVPTAGAGAGAGYDLDTLLSRLELLSALEGAPVVAPGAAMSISEQRGDSPHRGRTQVAEADTLRL